MRDHGVFEPGDLSGLDFPTWLAQIDDAASDDVFVDYLGPKHATVLWEQSKNPDRHISTPFGPVRLFIGCSDWLAIGARKGVVTSVRCQRTSGLVPRSPCHPPF